MLECRSERSEVGGVGVPGWALLGDRRTYDARSDASLLRASQPCARLPKVRVGVVMFSGAPRCPVAPTSVRSGRAPA